VRIAYDNERTPSTVLDCSTQLQCATENSVEDIATAVLTAISPYECFLPSNFLEDVLSGVSLPQVNSSNGSTIAILLSILEFFATNLI
jgi:hypothetical protein